ncbi:M55 family metallopeptidase [Clostridium sp. ATCC 25772]|uniref:M55 family metallopeptidase n=1 Tax=Clostridium sp. ATCC 25772 TaxID=1676991 RepID=UPI000782C38E|nr:M55 family metallopeptidase [Clostridium sp. ATCC 25772]
MKIFISADIEGVSDICHWNETTKGHEDYEEFKIQLTREVNAVCLGALKNNAADIFIKDAHESGRNIIHRDLPREANLIRGWAYHPYLMMEGLDKSFNCSIFIGYHSAGGTNGSPLAHTMDPNKILYIKINDEIASEFKINYYTSLYIGVPVVLVTGDRALCEEVKKVNENIKTIVTKTGVGGSAVNIHPMEIEDTILKTTENLIKEAVFDKFIEPLPNSFNVEISYKNHNDAYKASFFPKVELKDSNTITFKSKDYFEVLQAFLFLT